MTKTSLFILYVLLAFLVAGVFGAVHDQISYTVSHEYYTQFKFVQFGLLDANIPERLRAAEVGFLASWWMGWPLGIFTGIAGVIQKDVTQMRRALLWSLPVIAAFTLAFALCGLAYGYFQTAHMDPAAYHGWYFPTGLEQPRRFLCAGYMHNAAYLGGWFAIPFAWIFHILFRQCTSNTP